MDEGVANANKPDARYIRLIKPETEQLAMLAGNLSHLRFTFLSQMSPMMQWFQNENMSTKSVKVGVLSAAMFELASVFTWFHTLFAAAEVVACGY